VRAILCATLALIVARALSGQDTASLDTLWRLSGEGLLNFTQASFHQWAPGGENSLTIIGILGIQANAEHEKWTWNNSLKAAYGKARSAGEFRKSEDITELHSKYGRTVSEKTQYAVFLDAATQLDEGYNYPNDSVVVSEFIAPLNVIAGTGVDWIPAKDVSVLIAPVTGKMTFVSDTASVDPTIYGIDSGRMARFEFGASLTAKVERKVMDNITMSATVSLFSNYFDNPQNLDLLWDVLINMKVNKYVTASITTRMVYDHDILVPKSNEDGDTYQGIGLQFKEIIAVGLGYRF